MTNQGNQTEPEKAPEVEQPDVAKNTENQPGPIPYERFKEVNEQLKAVKQQLDEQLADGIRNKKRLTKSDLKASNNLNSWQQSANRN